MAKSPIGSRFLAIAPITLPWAVDEIVRALSADDLKKIKITAGEHLAAILATTFLGTAPVGVEPDGGPDLVFDLTNTERKDDEARILGVSGATRVAFEVKSLAGGFRKFDAGIDRAVSNGLPPDGREHWSRVTTLDEAFREHGLPMIERAREQLEKKATQGESRHVFLVAHILDHPAIELLEFPFMAHELAPLTQVTGVDAVWLLWAPGHLAIWSAEREEWTNLLFDLQADGHPSRHEDLSALQEVEALFLDAVSYTKGSPYYFVLSAGRAD
ncbi:hypothetical protein [Streptomyces sp. NPDC047985]|uniref:hypothetical protein n=1 Tax=unclassified Streptomyces TaxID=2593676 RepID=UPI003421AFFC